MTINSATPQDTFDHVFGSGATSYSWWVTVEGQGDTNMAAVYQPLQWQVLVTADDGDGTLKTVLVNHQTVMHAARTIVADDSYANTILRRECRNLVFDADEADFDACSGDVLLQYIVLGGLVYG